MAHGGDMQGVRVTREEAAAGLGFGSVDEMDRFYYLMKLIEPQVQTDLKQWYGNSAATSQIVFQVAAHSVRIFMEEEKRCQNKT